MVKSFGKATGCATSESGNQLDPTEDRLLRMLKDIFCQILKVENLKDF